MTIQEARIELKNTLSPIYDVSEADNIAELVIEHITDLKQSERILNKNKQLSESQSEELSKKKQRLLEHEPVQYVLGEAWFCGMKFNVDKNVLIPRPETEELVELIISNIKFPFETLRILDIGTGCGCIPVSLKRKLRKAEVWSCDISSGALSVAKRNADTLGADVKFIQLDFLQENQRKSLPLFDIIVSNPPYVPEKEKYQMRSNVLEYEPRIALFVPDNDPLVFYKAIADFGKKHLNEGGAIFLELHEEYAKETAALYRDENYTAEIKNDMQGKERLLHVKKL
ncbi:MAG: peptide chain release factor N(5)-glutamine methyltransferase [Bacteroidetes bacterium]|nr:peptide chain release factor N(5)-glutamine methyltransferase [Bacteroidota bacterium]